jgi:membrane protein implicated in regulation of membrane protease activity
MLAIGLILIIVAAGGGAYLTWLSLQSTTTIPLSGAGLSFGVLPITLLAAGAVAVLLLWAGFRLVAAGFRRRRAERRELRELRSSGGSTGTIRSTGRDDRPGPDRPALDRAERRDRSTDPGLERKVDPRA